MKVFKNIALIFLAGMMFLLGVCVGKEKTIENSALIECSNYHAAIRFGDEEIYYAADWQ